MCNKIIEIFLSKSVDVTGNGVIIINIEANNATKEQSMDKYIKQGIDIVSNNRARIESEIARIDARIEKVAGDERRVARALRDREKWENALNPVTPDIYTDAMRWKAQTLIQYANHGGLDQIPDTIIGFTEKLRAEPKRGEYDLD